MALYDLRDDQADFIKKLVAIVLPQGGTREDARKFLEMGDTILVQLNNPVHASKPKLMKQAEEDIKGLTPEERKVINEHKEQFHSQQ